MHHSTCLLHPYHQQCSNSHRSRNIVDEENDTYGVKQADRDIGANMEAHGKSLKDRVDDSDSVQKGPKKDHPTVDGRSQVGDEGDAHDLAHSRQP